MGRCKKCNKVMKSWKSLAVHMNNKKIPCDFQCKLCDVKSESAFYYKEHMKSNHGSTEDTLEEDTTDDPTVDFFVGEVPSDDIDDNSSEKSGIIYLVQPFQSFKYSESVYKIGVTQRTMKQRLAGYPKNTVLITEHKTKSCKTAEKLLKLIFNEEFDQRRDDYGTEYYYGEKDKMVSRIEKVLAALE